MDARRASAQAGRFPIGAEPYHREPFAADVSEGKNDPIYNAHSYHTKVPHRAIMRYILHYTDPGDIVLDGFCGTGMTGVAAQLCADKRAVESLGYRVADDGTVLDQKGRPFSRLGARRAILVDLCPAATFIAYNYNTPVDPDAFEREARRILQEVEEECGWMYETWHWPPSHSHSPAADSGKGVKGRILYTVWSDVFRCPLCNAEIVFWDVAVDRASGRVREQFSCPSCNALHTKRTLDRAWETVYDRALRQPIRRARQVPVLICYTVGKKRYEKTPDVDDLALLAQIEEADIPYWFPTDPLPEGYNTRQPMESHGITHVHHFYTRRNLWALAAIRDAMLRCSEHRISWALYFGFNNVHQRHNRMNAFRFGVSYPSNIQSGTLYVPSITKETNPFEQIANKLLRRMRPVFKICSRFPRYTLISTGSATHLLSCPDHSVDYIFVDPPFGANLMYSELNF
ncbi:MAG: DNA methyltransferase, partial [Anaerolineae bacterium]|nr:DNA methyltransferase [Anaerolineae bacterium]